MKNFWNNPISPQNKRGTKTSILQGLSAAWPICLGYIPIGLAFGVLAQKAGLYPIEIMLMSILVFAGSSQFIAVSMLSTGAGALSIILTTFAVNLRHLLMSSSLAVFLGNATRRKLTLFAYGVTDESFAVNYTRFSGKIWSVNRALVVNHTANLAWIVSSVIGGYSGRFIHQGAFGIDYALTAMFICLLILQLKSRLYVLTAVIAGAVAVILSLTIPGSSYIVLASIIAATTVLGLKKWGAK
ncbi:MAG: AzlC family ABC transporter permease [Desulfobacterales bacterium]|nr:AzlC family ABC transporter permease [Desulfobacterales bacterium]